MIVDALVAAVLGIWNFTTGLLPTGNLPLPSPAGLATVLAQLDSLVPILGPLSLALTILAALAAFIVVRLILVVVNIVWP